MTSTIQIDWREWKDWSNNPTGAIAKLNELLAPHGVKIERTNVDPFEGLQYDFLDLEARSTRWMIDAERNDNGVRFKSNNPETLQGMWGRSFSTRIEVERAIELLNREKARLGLLDVTYSVCECYNS